MAQNDEPLLEGPPEIFRGPPSLRDEPYSVPINLRQQLQAAIDHIELALDGAEEADFMAHFAAAHFYLGRVEAEILANGIKEEVHYTTIKTPL